MSWVKTARSMLGNCTPDEILDKLESDGCPSPEKALKAAVKLATDYTGVATRDLAAAIRVHLDRSECEVQDIFDENFGISILTVRKILDEKTVFTKLGRADKICIAFGLALDNEMVVIPDHRRSSATKMAADEYAILHGDGDDMKAWIENRAAELCALREEVLAQRVAS